MIYVILHFLGILMCDFFFYEHSNWMIVYIYNRTDHTVQFWNKIFNYKRIEYFEIK